MPEQFTYLALELGWALPPIFLQWFVGWQFLWRQRNAWWGAILILTTYLALVDATALGVVWTIAPGKSLGILVGNVPLEEIIFFLLTNTLVVQTIVLAAQTREMQAYWRVRLHKLNLRRFSDL